MSDDKVEQYTLKYRTIGIRGDSFTEFLPLTSPETQLDVDDQFEGDKLLFEIEGYRAWVDTDQVDYLIKLLIEARSKYNEDQKR